MGTPKPQDGKKSKKNFFKNLTMGKGVLDLRGRVFYYIIYSI